MSIPVILVAEIGLALLGKISFDLYNLVAVFFSFLFGLATIKALMKVAGKINFGWFCIFLGTLAVLTLFVG
jgi:undecaprenyl-diphosphatase